MSFSATRESVVLEIKMFLEGGFGDGVEEGLEREGGVQEHSQVNLC